VSTLTFPIKTGNLKFAVNALNEHALKAFETLYNEYRTYITIKYVYLFKNNINKLMLRKYASK